MCYSAAPGVLNACEKAAAEIDCLTTQVIDAYRDARPSTGFPPFDVPPGGIPPLQTTTTTTSSATTTTTTPEPDSLTAGAYGACESGVESGERASESEDFLAMGPVCELDAGQPEAMCPEQFEEGPERYDGPDWV